MSNKEFDEVFADVFSGLKKTAIDIIESRVSFVNKKYLYMDGYPDTLEDTIKFIKKQGLKEGDMSKSKKSLKEEDYEIRQVLEILKNLQVIANDEKLHAIALPKLQETQKLLPKLRDKPGFIAKFLDTILQLLKSVVGCEHIGIRTKYEGFWSKANENTKTVKPHDNASGDEVAPPKI